MEILRRLKNVGRRRNDGVGDELQPKDALRKIIAVMEAQQKEGLDDRIYVPNKYLIELAFVNDDEKDYLLSFLDEAELCAALGRYMAENEYFTRAPLDVIVTTVPMSADGIQREKMRVTARYEKAPPLLPAITPFPPAEPWINPEVMAADFHGPLPDDDPGDDATPPAIAWATLAITTPEGGKREFTITNSMIHIGRSRSVRNDIVLLNDGKASKVHVRIERERDGKYTLYDLDSTNGVTINGTFIRGNHVLKDLDEILIGATKLVFHSRDDSPSLAGRAELHAGTSIGDRIGPRVDSASGEAVPMRARLTDEAGLAHVLAFETLIGRSPTADIVLTDDSVSMRHARIDASDPGTYYLEDLGSENGTSVNGRLIAAGQRCLLANGDVIMLGQSELRFEFSTQE